MTIDETIKHYEELAEAEEQRAELHQKPDTDEWTYDACIKRASEYRQLEGWLIVLKEIWDSGCCNDCRNGQCEWRPKLGQLVRYNCPHYVGIANEEVNDGT